MHPKIYGYKTVSYFSGTTGFITVGLLIFSIGLLPTYYFLFGVSILFLLLIVFTTHYGLEINVRDKTFKQYLWILGYKQSRIHSYDLIEYAFIQSSKVSRTLYSTATSTTFSSRVYNGYLKFSEENKIHLIQASEKEAVLNKLHFLARDLKIEIVDFTDADSISILP
ncbi:hypothetical protein AHMF7605_01265 [Adhaeribacter arboris]|uniref:DUF304 domain-containing protein n=1 Tax=Adhaeribacter arboris TaxID=2072846 RepID=A0A2T2Y9R3_9BACT|nr:hypothetical protein [Adhaeribacter arboris]PSR52247.1 hypothetical protein AHMF7605_01265 [Adhaeribacter arboris]